MAVALNGFTKQLENFQNHQLLNKAVLDVVGVDVPMITLAKNNTERKERTFRQALVLLFAFIFAPIHGRFVARQVSQRVFKTPALKQLFKQHNLHPEVLLQANMKPLQSGLAATKKELQQRLSPTIYKNLAPHITKEFRHKLMRAKSAFLSWDMAVEGALFASLGWIKNAFTKAFLTGKDQFSGEIGIVSDKKLDALYKKEREAKKNRLEKGVRNGLLTAFGAIVPFVFGTFMGKATQQAAPKSKVMKTLKRWSKYFDYTYIKKWPMFSLAYIATIAVVMEAGELIAARSARERKERIIQRSILDTTFFGGDLFWMWLAGKYVFRNSPIKPSTFVKTTRERAENYAKKMKWDKTKSQQFIQKISKQSSRLFLFSFLANIGMVAGSITLANHITRQGVKRDSAELDASNNQPPLSLADLPIHPNRFSFNQALAH